MKRCRGSIDSVESMGLLDGPGIRNVVFLNGCKLRCKYCHNPEMWLKKDNNISVEELTQKIIRNKPYFTNGGGVTFSGGEPLLQSEFIIECCKILKKENINIALDTAGVGNGNYDEILKYVDLVLLDIKHTDEKEYKEITGKEMKEIENFIFSLNKSNKKVWIRQVIIPGINDNEKYIDKLINYLKHIKNIEKVTFLPFHRLGREKYIKLNIPYPYENKQDMDKEKCERLYELFLKRFFNN
ncbi:MAG: pyruvate formate lyase-activating protein [Bacilli bacterium]|nr:pyruvate formate lyase-activating protein [Bacilli bacterium]